MKTLDDKISFLETINDPLDVVALPQEHREALELGYAYLVKMAEKLPEAKNYKAVIEAFVNRDLRNYHNLLPKEMKKEEATHILRLYHMASILKTSFKLMGFLD